jgi:2-haloalkanoic acid dehalogenase type II
MTQSDIRVATFDCYGTLIDWEGGAGAFLYQLGLRNEDPHLDRGQVLRDRWEAIQFGLLTGPWRPYREVLARSLEAFCEERGWSYRKKDGEAFVRSMRAWQPFPDTRPALLQASARGLRLVILSNTDADIMAHSLRQLDLPFDDVITAEDVEAYKPSGVGFEYALSRIDEAPEHVLHVAFGFKYDIAPAQRQGMRTAWVNRHAVAAPGAERADHEWRDLWGLAELLGAPGANLSRGAATPS